MAAASFVGKNYAWRRGWQECGICHEPIKCCQKAVLCKDCRFGVGPCCLEDNGVCWLCNLERRAEKAMEAMPSPKSRFVVLGGSMVGSYFAFVMAKRGFQVDVYDKNADIGTWEGVINLHYPMVKVLEVDGILDDILEEHTKADTSVFRGKDWDHMISDYDLRKDALRYKLPPYMITANRKRYQEQIQEKATKAGARFHKGKEATSIEQKEGPGGFVKVTFKDGSTAEGDFLIGADGNRSFVRNTIFKAEGGDVAPISTQHWCSNGVVRDFQGFPDMIKERGQTEFWGPNGVFGFFPYKDEKMYIFMLQKGKRPEHPKDMERSAYQSILLDHLRKDFSSYDDFMGPMFDKLDPSTVGAFELPEVGKSLTTWNKGRVLLLGDAAHGMCNRLGAGGCTGMEDSHTAAELIEFCFRDLGAEREEDAIQRAFKLTTRRRRLRGLKVQAKSMEVAQMTILMSDSCMTPLIHSIVKSTYSTPEAKRDGSADFVVQFRVCAAHRIPQDEGVHVS